MIMIRIYGLVSVLTITTMMIQHSVPILYYNPHPLSTPTAHDTWRLRRSVDNLLKHSFRIVKNGSGDAIACPVGVGYGCDRSSLYGPSRALLGLWINCGYVDKSVDNTVDNLDRSNKFNGTKGFYWWQPVWSVLFRAHTGAAWVIATASPSVTFPYIWYS